jgi:hypothetical protein
MKDLSERFKDSNGQPIVFDDNTIYPLFKFNIQGKKEIHVKRLSHDKNHSQGIRIKITKGKLILDDILYEDIILWSDNSPSDLTILFEGKKDAQLKIWNCWRIDNIVQSWIGNYGIIIEEKIPNSTWILRCNSGTHNDISFDSIVFSIEIK